MPFTHEFGSQLHDWKLGKNAWHWTGHHEYYTSYVPSFNSNGNYLWTDSTISAGSITPSDALNEMLYYDGTLFGVTKQTQLRVKYFMHSTEKQCAILAVYFFEKSAQFSIDRMKFTSNSTTKWTDLVVDCQVDKCCDEYSCDLKLFVFGSAGCYRGSGFIAIESISATGVGEHRSNWSKFWTNWTTGPKALIWIFVISFASSVLGVVGYAIRKSKKTKKEDRTELI